MGFAANSTLTTAIGEIVVGTSKDDTFNVIAGTGATLNSFDSIDGAAGRDTLNLITDVATGGLPTTAQMKNVEIINAELAAAVTAVNSSALADVESLKVSGDLSGLATVTLGANQALTIGSSSNAAAALTLNVHKDETATTVTLVDADAATDLTLVGAKNTTLTVNGSVDGTLALKAADTTETINLGLTTEAVVTLNPAGADAVTTVDASTSTGDLTVDASTLAEVTTLLGGSGDDTLTGGAKSELINGGAGDDTITAGNVVDEVIIGGTGADAIDLGAGGQAQTVVIDAGDSGITLATADAITNFVSAEDLLDFNLEDGSATNFFADNSAGGFLDALVNANAAFANDSALRYVASSDGFDTWVFVDRDGNGSADQVVQLTGVAANIGFADIIA